MAADDETGDLRLAALQSVQTILRARQRAEQELIKTKEALEEETRILELLNQTGAKVASSLALDDVVQAVTDAGTRFSGAEIGAFFYATPTADGNAFSLSALSGALREELERLGEPGAAAIFAPTLCSEGVTRLADVSEDSRYGQMRQTQVAGTPPGNLAVRSYLAVPVVARSGNLIGGLFFGHQERGIFSERSERLIVGIAAQAAIAIDNARLYEEAKRAADERASLLTAERAARAEIERVSLLKDEFLSTLSHELRTPLNAVLGWSAALLRRREADSDTRHGLEAILRNSRAQAQLIEDLLDMNRIVSGKIRLDMQWLELGTIIEAAFDSVRPSAEAKSIAIRHSVEPRRGSRDGRPESPPAGHMEPTEQRGEVHPERRPNRGIRRARGFARRDLGTRLRDRHQLRVPAARL